MRKTQSETNRIIYLDVLRVLATVAVIVIHVTSQRWNIAKADEWDALNLFNSISRWAVPVFVMISGALFLSGDRPIREIYKKNILRIITAFVFWSVIYSVLVCINGADRQEVIFRLFTGYTHLWFLFMIAGLYIMIPFFRKIIEKESLTRYFLLLALVFAFILPQVTAITEICAPQVNAVLSAIQSKANISVVMGYSGYFILGYVLNKKDTNKRKAVIYIIGALGFITTVIGSRAVHFAGIADKELFYQYLTVNVLFEAVAVFTIIKNACQKIPGRILQNKGIGKLSGMSSKYSFGIYLVHVAVIMALGKVGITTQWNNPYAAVIIITAATFLLSFAISAILNHIPVIKKYFV